MLLSLPHSCSFCAVFWATTTVKSVLVACSNATRQPAWSRWLLYRWTWQIVRQVHEHSPRGSHRCRNHPKSADKFVVEDIVQYALLRASYWTIFTALLSVLGYRSLWGLRPSSACDVMWCDVMRSRKLCSIFFEPDNRQSSTGHHQSNYYAAAYTAEHQGRTQRAIKGFMFPQIAIDCVANGDIFLTDIIGYDRLKLSLKICTFKMKSWLPRCKSTVILLHFNVACTFDIRH